MKTRIICCIILGLSIFGCEEENKNELVGKWQWIETCNLNLYIGCNHAYNKDFKKYVEFTSNNEIIYKTDDSITLDMNFKLSQVYYNRFKMTINAIMINDAFFQKYLIKHDTLILSDTCFECNYSEYRRIN